MLPTTPSHEACRQEFATAIQTALDAWAQQPGGWAVAVEPENRDLIDLTSPQALRPCLAWQLQFRDGLQASLGQQPIMRQFGQLFAAIKIKQGAGSAECYRLLDFLIPYLERRDFAVTRTEAAEAQTPVDVQGWHCVPLLVSFWIDRVAA